MKRSLRFFTFSEWVKNNPELKAEIEKSAELGDLECSACDGTGEVICECKTCGNEHTNECAQCEGSGENTDFMAALQDIYDAQLAGDQQKALREGLFEETAAA